MPIAQSRTQPIAPVSFCMIFDKVFIIPPKNVASPPVQPADLPVILRREDEEQWLDVSGARFDKARLVLKPYLSDQMDAYDVSTLVNKPENDSAECIQPDSGHDIFTPQLSLL